MHISRIVAIIGVLIGIVGLFMKSLTTEGEGLLLQLAQANPAFPDGIPTIWGGLDTWAQVVVVIAIVVVLVLALRPPLPAPFDRTGAAVVSVIGLGLTIYAIVKFMEAGDSADTLQAGFAEAAAGGALPEAFTVSTGIGFFVLMAGTVLVLIGGLLAMRGMSDDRDGTVV
jgi:hypothetical protein